LSFEHFSLSARALPGACQPFSFSMRKPWLTG
jgi:hypothetical protein